ncbi:MAG TPA: hypothetical protein VG838_12895 [Opitutaceae bacterium]|nr:hypothetical protein [Opitutaceae bacterium]
MAAFTLTVAVRAGTAELPLERYATVTVEPAKTSIYVGSVTLTTPGFTREGVTYSANYTAKVFPYFFYNEKGRIWIDVPDADLRRLERGETVNFTGHARSDDGDERRVEGRAEPTGASTGKIKVRIFVSKRIELIFNTTYRFPKA